MSNDRDVWEDPEHDWAEFDEDDCELSRPNRHRWIAWVLVGALAIAPLYTLLSVLKIAPVLVIVVAGFSIAAVYFVRASRSDNSDRDDS